MKRVKLLLWLSGSLLLAPAYSETSATHLALTSKQIAKLSQLFPATNESTERIVWDKLPIEVVLPLEKERLVSFPGPVEFGYDVTQLPAEKLTVQNNNGTVYLTAHREFPIQRVQVRLVDSGKVILLNVSAKQEGPKPPLSIILAEPNAEAEVATQSSALKSVSLVGLTRYAVQKLYAPKRFEPNSPAIFHAAMQAYPVEPLLLDGSVIAHPKASWHNGALYITAVELRNQLAHELELDPRKLCGEWKAATFYPRTTLSARGSLNDATDVFLISTLPFGKAMSACRPGGHDGN